MENLYFLGSKEQTHTGTCHPTEITESVQKTVDNKTAKSLLVSLQLLAKPKQPHYFVFLRDDSGYAQPSKLLLHSALKCSCHDFLIFFHKIQIIKVITRK